jgi:hypothetical protein
VKNQWIKIKLKINLYLGMANQRTKYQMNVCKQREKKVRKTDNSWYFSKSKGHTCNFVKNQWIKAKLKLNLYLGIAKQCTKYLMNMRKKCLKMIIRDFFPSPRAITSWKINGSEPNSNLICILVWQINVPNIKWISVCREKKSPENCKIPQGV